MPLSAGDKLSHYEIVSLLGKGGMGEVYRARDTTLKRDVALKVLPAELSNDAERIARFQREAEVLASLNHSNIAQVYGVAESDGTRALVMELVEGESPRGPLPFDDAWKIMTQVAEGLEYAHERGVVHRDLKPSNLKVTPDGRVKILDFGLAKALSLGQRASVSGGYDSPTLTMGATQAGVILGTAGYMAPEQIKGKEADRRADIWAFGVVLYELLTGERPFQGKDSTEIMAHAVTSKPNLDKAPARVRRLLGECLKKEPEERLRWVGDLARFLDEPPPAIAVATAPSRSRLNVAAVVTAGVFGIALAGLSFFHFREQPAQKQVLQYTLTAPEKAGRVQQFAISPDGHYLVMRASGEGGTQLWVRSTDSLQSQPLAGTANAGYPFWSPDSRYIGFFADGKLKKISVSGGPAQTLCDAPYGRGGAWNQSGVIVFTPTRPGGLSRVPAVGGAPVPITKTDGAITVHRNPTFLPDGRRFLYAATGNNTGNNNGIFLGSLDENPEREGGDRRILADASYATYFNGYLLFVRETTLMAQPVDPKTMELKGDLFPVAEQVSPGGNPSDELYSISGNGTLVFQTGAGPQGRQHIWKDRTGKELGPAGGVMTSLNNFALSPDGKRFVTQRVAQDRTSSDLWITDLEHSTDSRLTTDPSVNQIPIWSSDGTKIVFASNRGGVGTGDLYQRASNGTGQDELLLKSKEPKVPWDWSRDGRFIVYMVGKQKGDDIWVFPMIGDKKPFPLLQSEFQKRQAQISPDDRWLAYTSVESGRPEIYVVPFSPIAKADSKPGAGKWTVSTAGGTQPRWRGDGKELFYVAPDGKLMAVEIKANVTAFDRGAPQALFDLRSVILPSNTATTAYVPAPDGKRFLVATTAGATAEAPPLTVVVNWLASVKK